MKPQLGIWYITDSILWICGIIIIQALLLRPAIVCIGARSCCSPLPVIPLRHLGFSDGGGGAVYQARPRGDSPGTPIRFSRACVLVWLLRRLFCHSRSRREARRIQILYWVTAVGCLLVVALTIERGPLLATALAVTIAFRRILNRGFLPMLLLIILTGIVIESGMFVGSVAQYQTRGSEDTGRLTMWPVIIERFLESPLFGVGYLKQGTDIGLRSIPPHNTFLQFALTSGIVPFAFFVAFWIRGAVASVTHDDRSESAVFRLPFLVYAFVFFMLGDVSTVPPILLMLSVIAGRGIPYSTKLVAVPRRIPRSGAAPSLARPSPGARSTLK